MRPDTSDGGQDTSKSMQADEEDEDVDARDFTVVFRLIDNRKPKKLRKTKCDFSRTNSLKPDVRIAGPLPGQEVLPARQRASKQAIFPQMTGQPDLVGIFWVLLDSRHSALESDLRDSQLEGNSILTVLLILCFHSFPRIERRGRKNSQPIKTKFFVCEHMFV